MNAIQSFKYLLYPSKEQEQKMLQTSGCRRFVWNWALARCQEHYAATGRHLSRFSLGKELTEFKRTEGGAFLREVSTTAVRSSLIALENAFNAFFAKRGKYPRFKSKDRDGIRFSFDNAGASPKDSGLWLPTIGLVKAKGRECPAKIIAVHVSQRGDGNWYASCKCRIQVAPLPETGNPVGVDLGLSSLATLTTGEKIDAPKFYRTTERKLKRASQSLNRKKKGSANRAKAKKRLAIVHRNIKRKREGFLHALTTRIVRQNDLIAVEDLNTNGLVKTKLAKSINDAAWGELLRQLEYKCLWYGRIFVKVGRFYPSSKTCSNCGFIQSLKLSERIWQCELCSTVHDRDYNAAINILAEGKRIVASRRLETLNARGGDVSPESVQAVADETGRF